MEQKERANSALGEAQHRLTETFVTVKMSCGWFHRRRVDVNWLTATWQARPSFRRLSLSSTTLASITCGSLYRTSSTLDNKRGCSSNRNVFVSPVNCGINYAVLNRIQNYFYIGRACRVGMSCGHVVSCAEFYKTNGKYRQNVIHVVKQILPFTASIPVIFTAA